MLGHLGIPAHVFPSGASPAALANVDKLSPRILVSLVDRLDESGLPPSVEVCVTFRRPYLLERVAQLDLYLVDELGFLAHSTDMREWVVYNDQCFFETATDGGLVVTALRNTTLPLVRLKTMDSVASLEPHHVRLACLDPSG